MSLYTQTPDYYLDQVQAALSKGSAIESPVVTVDSPAITLEGTKVVIAGLPTVDPAVVGQLWNDTGVLTVSAG